MLNSGIKKDVTEMQRSMTYPLKRSLLFVCTEHVKRTNCASVTMPGRKNGVHDATYIYVCHLNTPLEMPSKQIAGSSMRSEQTQT
jgi:hypothetical protein